MLRRPPTPLAPPNWASRVRRLPPGAP
uniref:Predicted protein n=1 Tax=Hordeum vulgare subsp. vulgare TaxID=112509 RepID=F2DTS0_HORVV|nr:predicted protein [Hordeum vulgare subsp. vulgare]